MVRLARGLIVLDLLGIVFSTAMIIFVVFRAVQLDRTRPWFEAAQPEPEQATVQPGRSPAPPVPWRGTRR